jgi:citronellol/citronellal dehydrogenase
VTSTGAQIIHRQRPACEAPNRDQATRACGLCRGAQIGRGWCGVGTATSELSSLIMESQMSSLAGKTIIMSGGSRGIGEAIAVRAAADGANVAIIAKTAEPHPKLPGTIYTAAEAIEKAGGKALPIVTDVRDEAAVEAAVAKTVETFGGIDIVVNNASAINLTPTEHLSVKAYDLMTTINTRGTFVLSKYSIPHLRKSSNAHILTLSPPISTDPKWFGTVGVGYIVSKYGMSLATLGLAEELRGDGIAANSLWPRTVIDTAAVRNVVGSELVKTARTAQIMADAAYAIVTKPTSVTGQFFIDDEVLLADGVTDFSPYRLCDSEEELTLDLWVEPATSGPLSVVGKNSKNNLG